MRTITTDDDVVGNSSTNSTDVGGCWKISWIKYIMHNVLHTTLSQKLGGVGSNLYTTLYIVLSCIHHTLSVGELIAGHARNSTVG